MEFRDIFKEESNSLEFTGEAMNYILDIDGGGKRLRFGLVGSISISFCVDSNVAFGFAKSMETIHAYTLIIDDIQDKALTGRGEKAGHIKYGFNTAVLAASRLFEKGTHYFHEHLNQTIFTGLSDNLHRGRSADLESVNWVSENRIVENPRFTHGGKTSSLIQMAALGGCYAAKLNSHETNKISKFGYYLSLAYQAIDEIQTIEGEQSLLGKAKSEDVDKLTYPNLLGSLKKSKAELKGLIESAKDRSNGLSPKKQPYFIT